MLITVSQSKKRKEKKKVYGVNVKETFRVIYYLTSNSSCATRPRNTIDELHTFQREVERFNAVTAMYIGLELQSKSPIGEKDEERNDNLSLSLSLKTWYISTTRLRNKSPCTPVRKIFNRL